MNWCTHEMPLQVPDGGFPHCATTVGKKISNVDLPLERITIVNVFTGSFVKHLKYISHYYELTHQQLESSLQLLCGGWMDASDSNGSVKFRQEALPWPRWGGWGFRDAVATCM